MACTQVTKRDGMMVDFDAEKSGRRLLRQVMPHANSICRWRPT